MIRRCYAACTDPNSHYMEDGLPGSIFVAHKQISIEFFPSSGKTEASNPSLPSACRRTDRGTASIGASAEEQMFEKM